MRKVTVIAAIALPLMVAACGDKPAEQSETAEQAAPAAPQPVEELGMVLSDAAVRLPAVAGHPGVAYFTLQSKRDTPIRIASVSVMGAGEAELHESMMEDGVAMMGSAGSILMEPMETVKFAPGGFHVMLFDLDATLAAGGMTDLTVTLDNGDKISATAMVVGPADDLPGHHGGAMGDMPMDGAAMGNAAMNGTAMHHAGTAN